MFFKALIGVPLLIASVIGVGCQPPPQPVEAQTPPPPGSDYEGEAFTFHKIREDIYHAVGTGNLAVGCNGAIVINADDVLVVDSHMTPAAAWALLRELGNITPKPVRYVVNTHFHFDHLHGNQVFPEDVEIIGHEFTREMVVTGKSTSGRSYDSYIGTLPERIEEMNRELEATTDADKRSDLEEQVADLKRFKLATDAVEPIPPNITMTRRLTLHRGGREIKLMFFGRGHTGGDVVVYLPHEKILITGDLLVEGLPYIGDGYPLEWIETLEQLKGLEFDVVLGGHGQAFGKREKIDHLQAYLGDFWERTVEMYRNGVGAEEAAGRIDMRSHAEHFPQITDLGANPHAVLRVYELLNEVE
jgi:glyoxylase-like metal-dependent hydrolase (beta-lactamase superfamily II)